jgi:two-component system cell cycle response regulator PopA
MDDPPAALSLCGAVRRNARLHHIPVLTLVKPDDLDTREAALARGATLIAGEGDDLDASMAWLAADVDRARRRRYALAALAAAPEPTTPWTRVTFAAHLQTLADAHHMRGRPLCVGVVRARAARPRNDVWTRGFGELADLAARLVRASDSLAALDETTLIFAFPSAQEAGARAALKRVLAVWDCTAFAAGGEGQAALAFTSEAVELLPGESGAGLLARTCDLLDRRVGRY